MKTVGIICEYDPFHKGHKYQIETAGELTGADASVCIMSGHFTQRGMPALVDKWTRTEMALAGGADLVIELPVVFACNGADIFARGAVSILAKMGCIDALSFGCTAADPDKLIAAGKLMASESSSKLPESRLNELQASEEPGISGSADSADEAPETFQDDITLSFRQHLKQALNSGMTYPRAVQCAAAECFGNELAEELSEPNNILAVQYIKALAELEKASGESKNNGESIDSGQSEDSRESKDNGQSKDISESKANEASKDISESKANGASKDISESKADGRSGPIEIVPVLRRGSTHGSMLPNVSAGDEGDVVKDDACHQESVRDPEVGYHKDDACHQDSSRDNDPAAVVKTIPEENTDLLLSSTAIRQMLQQMRHGRQATLDAGGKADLVRALPESSLQILGKYSDEMFLKESDPFSRFETVVMSTLMRSSADELEALASSGEGLGHAIKKHLRYANGLEDLVNKVAGKRYTKSRIQRILCQSLLGITRESVSDALDAPYARILGMTEKGARLLREIKKTEASEIPIITNINKQTDETAGMLKHDILATDIYNLITGKDAYSNCDMVHSPMILK